MSQSTPEEVLASIVHGINIGDLAVLMPLYEASAGLAAEPGRLSHGLAGVREGLSGFIAMKGKLDLKVTRVLEASLSLPPKTEPVLLFQREVSAWLGSDIRTRIV
jgi:hypothetical protein